MPEDVLGLGLHVRLNPQEVLVEPPEFVTGAALVLRRLVLLDIADELVDVLELILAEKARVAQEFSQVLAITVQVLSQEAVGQDLDWVKGQVFSQLELDLFLGRGQDVLR